jgi:hypothetical protein
VNKKTVRNTKAETADRESVSNTTQSATGPKDYQAPRNRHECRKLAALTRRVKAGV